MGSSELLEEAGKSSQGSWSTLIARANGGCRESFDQLSQNCLNYLLMAAQEELGRDLRRNLAPSDLVQQTLLVAYTKIGKFRGNSAAEFARWLQMILSHVAATHGRYYRRDKRRSDRNVPLERDLLVADEATPSQMVIDDDRRKRMRESMHKLPEHQREVLYLHFMDGLNFQEIGDRTGRSADACRKLWLNALRTLKTIIPHDDDPGTP